MASDERKSFMNIKTDDNEDVEVDKVKGIIIFI
jgi:hypothetical protein